MRSNLITDCPMKLLGIFFGTVDRVDGEKEWLG